MRWIKYKSYLFGAAKVLRLILKKKAEDKVVDFELNLNDLPKDILFSTAERAQKKAPQEFKRSAWLYFLCRSFVSRYEVEYDELPIQVWNEFRNALDHYFRSITILQKHGESETSYSDRSLTERATQLKKMEGHLQRALLDILKFYCHETKEYLDSTVQKNISRGIDIVDNGNFFKDLVNKLSDAETKFLEAKIEDNNLGNEAQQNDHVVKLYLDAAYNYVDTKKMWDSKKADVQLIFLRSSYLRTKSLLKNSIISLINNALWVLLGAIFSVFFPTIKNFF